MRPILISFLIVSATLLAAAEPARLGVTDKTSGLPDPTGIDTIPNNAVLVTLAKVSYNDGKPSSVMYQALVPRSATPAPFIFDFQHSVANSKFLKSGMLIRGDVCEVPDDPEHHFAVYISWFNQLPVFKPFLDGKDGSAKDDTIVLAGSHATFSQEFPEQSGKWINMGNMENSYEKKESSSLLYFLRFDRSLAAKPFAALPHSIDEFRFSLEANVPTSAVTTWLAQRIAPRTLTLDPKLSDTPISIHLTNVTPDEALHKICDQEGWTLTQDTSGYRIAPKSAPAKPQPNF